MNQTNETTIESRTCACGCGGTPRLRSSRYLPGHHKQRPDPLEGRFIVDAATDCWVFQGYKLSSGYGQVTYRGRKWLAHRLSYFLEHGTLPPAGLQVHHSCRNRACVNPAHLVAVTPTEHRRVALTKLDLSKARLILELWPSQTQVQIAERFGVDQTTISLVLRGVIYRDAQAA